MKIYSHNNHFKFGYDQAWFTDRRSSEQRFTVAFDRCEQPVLDWRSETIAAAKLIGESTDLSINLLYSGGIDSEVALIAFLDARVPITAHIMRFSDDLNWHDIQYAVEFCKMRDVSYYVYDLDILNFFEGEMYDYAAATHCASPQLCATMWLVDQVGGFPVIGQGECVLVRQDDEWYFRESEMINSYYRHFMIRDRIGVPGFHQYTSGQMLSYLLDSTFLPYMHPDSGKTSNKTTKIKTYQRHFSLKHRPKFTGFECLMEQDHRHRPKLVARYGDWMNFALFEYSEFVASLQCSS